MVRAVLNEFAKMRRLRVVSVAVVMVAGVVALSSISFVNPGFMESVDEPTAEAWQWLLGGMSTCVPVVSPILLAVLASRPVDIEHQGNGWLFSQAAGLTPGHLCRVKFVATGVIVVVATAVQSVVLLGFGKLSGIEHTLPVGEWAGYTAAVMVVNLVFFALHLLLSARISNQLVALGLGVLGVFVAVACTGMPKWLAHFFPPWGYYALVTPVDSRESGMVSLEPSYLSVVALGVVGAALFLAVTRVFDRKEA
jgi:hypothetical protein